MQQGGDLDMLETADSPALRVICDSGPGRQQTAAEEQRSLC